MGTLKEKTAIVTGSGKGIGRGEALALAKEGAAVTLLSRTAAEINSVAEEIEAIGGKAMPIVCDVTLRDQVDHVVATTLEAHGTIDILVNNAQWVPPPHPAETWTEEEIRVVWESGFLGTFNFMQACFPLMKAQGAGRIINIVSVVGYSGMPMYSGYAATKEAIRSYSRATAKEWGALGITVNTISPAVASALLLEQYPDEESQRAIMDAAGMVIKRFGDAEADVGRAVVFLAGPDASLITGCTLSVDAGSHML